MAQEIDERKLNLYRISIRMGKMTIAQVPEPYKSIILSEQTTAEE